MVAALYLLGHSRVASALRSAIFLLLVIAASRPMISHAQDPNPFNELSKIPEPPGKPLFPPDMVLSGPVSVRVVNRTNSDEMTVIARRREDWLGNHRRDQDERARLLAQIGPVHQNLSSDVMHSLQFDTEGFGLGLGPGAASGVPNPGPPMKKSGTAIMVPIISLKVPN